MFQASGRLVCSNEAQGALDGSTRTSCLAMSGDSCISLLLLFFVLECGTSCFWSGMPLSCESYNL